MKSKVFGVIAVIGLLAIYLLAMLGLNSKIAKTSTVPIPVAVQATDSPLQPPAEAWQNERDEIYSLLAYSIVFKDWQTKGGSQRGHNIGALLVNPEGKIVYWARNCSYKMKNTTQHAEVRLIIGYLEQKKLYNLKGYSIYTSLEPCAMCSGMMAMARIKRVVYGQTDPLYGGAINRLDLDSTFCQGGGYRPYPRSVISVPSSAMIQKRLDVDYNLSGISSVSAYLLSERAKKIYKEANDLFVNYTVKFQQNKAVLDQAREYLKMVGED